MNDEQIDALVPVPQPVCTYADHSYPAFTRTQLITHTRAAVRADRAAREVAISRDEARRYCDAGFQRWLDESVTENGEFTVFHLLKNVHDAYSGWCAFQHYGQAAQEVPNAGGAVAVPVAVFEQCTKALRDFSQAPTDYHRSVLRMRDALSALAASPAPADGGR